MVEIMMMMMIMGIMWLGVQAGKLGQLKFRTYHTVPPFYILHCVRYIRHSEIYITQCHRLRRYTSDGDYNITMTMVVAAVVV